MFFRLVSHLEPHGQITLSCKDFLWENRGIYSSEFRFLQPLFRSNHWHRRHLIWSAAVIFCASAVVFCCVGCRQGHLSDVCITCPSWKGERDVSQGRAQCCGQGYQTRSQTQIGKTSVLHKDSKAVQCNWKWFFAVGFEFLLFILGFLLVLLPLWYFSPYNEFGICSLLSPGLFHGTCMTSVCQQFVGRMTPRLEKELKGISF